MQTYMHPDLYKLLADQYRLEAEQDAAKRRLLRRADVPTADYHVFHDAESAARFISDRYPSGTEDVPVVVKADGLAAGKGVIVCSRREQALQAIQRIAADREFGDAGDRIVIEERLDGTRKVHFRDRYLRYHAVPDPAHNKRQPSSPRPRYEGAHVVAQVAP